MKLLEGILFLGCIYIPPPISGHCCHKCIEQTSRSYGEPLVSKSVKGCSIGCSGHVENTEDTCDSATLPRFYCSNSLTDCNVFGCDCKEPCIRLHQCSAMNPMMDTTETSVFKDKNTGNNKDKRANATVLSISAFGKLLLKSKHHSKSYTPSASFFSAVHSASSLPYTIDPPKGSWTINGEHYKHSDIEAAIRFLKIDFDGNMKIDCKEAYQFNRDAFVGEIGTRKTAAEACSTKHWIAENKNLKLIEIGIPNDLIEPKEFDNGLKALDPERLDDLMKHVLTHPMVHNR